MQFIPTGWLELAAANRRTRVYSRAFPGFVASPATLPASKESQDRVAKLLEELLGDLLPRKQAKAASVKYEETPHLNGPERKHP